MFPEKSSYINYCQRNRKRKIVFNVSILNRLIMRNCLENHGSKLIYLYNWVLRSKEVPSSYYFCWTKSLFVLMCACHHSSSPYPSFEWWSCERSHPRPCVDSRSNKIGISGNQNAKQPTQLQPKSTRFSTKTQPADNQLFNLMCPKTHIYPERNWHIRW